MKGLLRNNFYTVESTLKGMILVVILVFVVMMVVGLNGWDEHFSVEIFGLGAIGSFSSTFLALVQNDSTSKWCRFELTTPITKADVIKARYITFATGSIVGVVSYIIIYAVYYTIIGGVDLERFGYFVSFVITYLLILPSIMHPLVLKFGMDKGQFIFVMSALFAATYLILPEFLLKNMPISNFTYRITMLTISVLIFVGSYLISKNMYLKKDL
ncbi:MAG: ABC-2 transporter permease [Bacillota bacterium]